MEEEYSSKLSILNQGFCIYRNSLTGKCVYMYVLLRTINSLRKRPNNHQKHHQNHLQNLIITHNILRFSGYSRVLGIHLFLTKSSTLLSKTNPPHQTLMKRKPKQLHSITCSTNWSWWGGVVPSSFLHHN